VKLVPLSSVQPDSGNGGRSFTADRERNRSGCRLGLRREQRLNLPQFVRCSIRLHAFLLDVPLRLALSPMVCAQPNSSRP